MKKWYFLLLLLSIQLIFSNCNKEESEDLTIEIVGEYKGKYADNVIGEIDDYNVVVTKIDKNHIKVKPKSGTEFSEAEFELVRTNDSAIISPNDDNQQLEKSVIFITGISVSISMTLDPTTDAKEYIGEKQ